MQSLIEPQQYPQRHGVALLDRQEAPRPHRLYDQGKRLIDLILGGVALVFLSPLLGLIALLINVTSSGPALFCQERVGKNGNIFTMYKFRSMYDNQSDELHRAAFGRWIQGRAITPGGSGSSLFKLSADPRVTPLGRILRRVSADELPQLLNVVRGEMSLVGPRPAIRYEVEQYAARHAGRLAVKPGLTGLWQVRGRGRVTFEEMVDLDLEYIRRRSLIFDLHIALATIPVVLHRRGAN